jgi:ferredoxin-NADP reductase/DMSO/TMAO reductase YedYZ heme-binding membrane subunit
MSTIEPLIDSRFAKRVVIVNGLVPATLLLWDAFRHQLGVNTVNFAIRTTGLVGLVFITLSLAITPLRALTGWNRLIAVRRNLGVLGFLYIAAHFVIFYAFDREGSISSTLSEIAKRRYLWFGTAALTLMIPLAGTSTDMMVLRLGAKHWKLLHRLAYAIAASAVVHYYLLVKADVRQPLAFAAVLGLLLSYRVVAHYLGLRAEVRRARAGTAGAARSAQKKAFWSGELMIVRIFDETPDVKTFRLAAVDGALLPFTHTAGQYLTVALTIDGTRVNRSYTIASAPTRGAYCEISVKRLPDGYASRYIHDNWREGERVKVSGPAGRFVFVSDGAERVVMIGGGIGITPMMATVRSLTDRGWRGEMFLLFSVRAVHDIVFRDELAYLQARFPNLHVQVIVSRDPESAWEGARGQITGDVIAGFVPELRRGPVLLCGPMPMMNAMRTLLVAMGVPDAEILEEVFLSPATIPSAGASNPPPEFDDGPDDGVVANVRFRRTNKVAELPTDVTVLEAAERVGVDIPFECRSGICGQCRTTLLSGRVTMDVQDALTAADRTNGLILACQARARRDIEVDA